MKVIDVYQQYFAAECVYQGVERRGVSVKLTAVSEEGTIRYEVSVSFFPHLTPEDFSVSYDAYAQQTLFAEQGRRSKKRDAEYLKKVPAAADALAEALGGTIAWDKPLREARYDG